MQQTVTYYDLLEVKETASGQVIKGAYRFLSQQWHPDRNPDSREEAERKTKELNEAYSVLSDPLKRAEYDEWLKSQRDGKGGRKQASPPSPTAPAFEDRRGEKRKGKAGKVLAVFAVLAFLAVSAVLGLAAVESGVAVGVRVAFSSSCYADSLLVTTTNRLPIPLLSHSYRISGNLPGYSDAIRGSTRVYESDKIIPGWSSSSVCQRAPPGFNDFRVSESESAARNKKQNPHLVWVADLRSAYWVGPFFYFSY